MTSFYGEGGGSISESKPQPGAMIFKGMIGALENDATIISLPNSHLAGWTYLVVTAGTYANETCEVGDFIVCIADGEVSSDLDWKVIQGNVFGPTLPAIGENDIGKAIVVSDENKYSLQSLEFLSNKGDSSDNDYSFRTVTVNELEINNDAKIKIKEDKLSITNNKDEYSTLSGASPENENDFTTKGYVKEKYAPIESAICPTANGNPAICNNSIEWGFQGLKIYGKSTQVTTIGAQLFDAKSFTEKNTEYYKLSEDGGIIQIRSDFRVLNSLPISQELAAGTYTASINTANFNFQIIQSGVEVGSASSTSKFTFTLEAPAQISFKAWSRNESDYSRVTAYPMLNVGSTALPWEPYTGGKPSPSSEYPQPIVSAGDGGSIALTVSDGLDQSQSLTLFTPSGLPGIPVTSGGNYTDAEGQQSACDVKDYGTGKYTQMVGHIESYNGENITTPYMSTTGQLSTGAEVYYVLDEPVVTDTSDDELAAYHALHTYDGTTVISTTEPVAGIEARYIADGAGYIENIQNEIKVANKNMDIMLGVDN